MLLMKVKIRDLECDGPYQQQEATIVEIDGKRLVLGTYGGEPEDASRSRDYSWVELALERLARALGAEVEYTFEPLEPEAYEEELYP